jgi:ABC-type transporter Mla subunit MlaD
MITKEQKFRLGVFLFISFLLLIAVLAVFIVPKLQEKGDTYFIDFKEMSVNGLNDGSDVKYQGVRIGKVDRMDVNPEDLSNIRVYVKLKSGFPVKKDMRAKLQYAGITGLRFVELSGGRTKSEDLEPGGEILMGKGLGEKAEDIVLNIDSVVDAINDVLKPENRGKISGLLSNIEKSTAVLARVLGKGEKNLGNLFVNIDKSTAELKNITAEIKTFTQNLSGITEKVEWEKIGRDGNRMISNISDRFSPQELGDVIKNFNTFVKTSTSSIKKIESSFLDLDGELNNTLISLRESIENIAKLTRELTEDPTMLIRTKTEKRSKK